MFTVELSEQIYQLCADFADERIGASEMLYRLRGEDSLAKMRDDIITGALGEFAVYQYLRSQGLNCSRPDLSIHPAGQKSFAADLKSEGVTLHVKAQSVKSAARYGASWLFQKEDSLFTLPSEHSRFVFCLVNGRTVDIKAFVNQIELVEAEITKEPKVFKYKHSKHALYLDDVLNSGVQLWNLPTKQQKLLKSNVGAGDLLTKQT